MTSIDEDRLNVAIRKFLKVVGITSQREIEKAVREAVDSGTLPDSEPDSEKLQARMTLTVPELGLEHVIDHEIDTGK
jgi:hypothetical protein